MNSLKNIWSQFKKFIRFDQSTFIEISNDRYESGNALIVVLLSLLSIYIPLVINASVVNIADIIFYGVVDGIFAWLFANLAIWFLLSRAFNQISNDFHARYSAKERTYVYSTMDNQKKLPYLLNSTHQHNSSLDLEKLNEISQLFLGKNDFSSFAKVEKNKNPEREIFKSVWKKNSNIFTYTITGNSFLRNMVRNLVGVQLAFNDNKLTLKEIKSQLDKPDGNRLNYIAPANGLTLWKVKY